jgi:Ca-activated chloride channel family protein
MIHVQDSKLSEPTDDMNFASAVALFGMKLIQSQYDNNVSISKIIELANKGRGDDKDGYRAEFIRLVESYQHL